MSDPMREAYPAQWHAAEAERLIREAKSSFYANGPLGLDRAGCATLAQAHATLAVYYQQASRPALPEVPESNGDDHA